MKPDSQEQVKDLEKEPVSLAAPTRKWSQGGKALSLFASLFLFITPASNATNVQKVTGGSSAVGCGRKVALGCHPLANPPLLLLCVPDPALEGFIFISGLE